MFTVYGPEVWNEGTGIQGLYDSVHASEFVSISERGLFGGNINTSDSNSDGTSNTFSPPAEREQTEEGENSYGSEVDSGEETPSISIDPASSDSLSVLSHRISADEILDDPTMDIDGEIQNNGTQSLDFVKVTATFYGMSNSVIGSDFTYTDPYALEPGQSAPFKVSTGFGDNIPVDEIASIKLHVGGRASETFVPLSGREQGEGQQFSNYTDPEGRFTIDYPSEWYVNEEPSDDKESVVQFDSIYDPDTIEGGITNEDLTMPTIRVVIRDAKPDETSLESLTNKKISDFANFKVVQESEPVTLSGLPAHSIKTSVGFSDNLGKQVWSLHDGKVYQLLYMAHPYDYENHVSAFERMVESFQFTR